jgi:MFS superfamily sulfate permease-like transporter
MLLIHQLPEANPVVFGFGILSVLFLVAGQRILPGRPVAILLVILSIVVMSTTSLVSSGFSLTGAIPAGLPHITVPRLGVQDVDGIIPLAFACFLLAYIESVSAAKALAIRGGYEIDSRQELLALAAANAATALGQGYPVTGGLSQSAVNARAGAKSPFSLVVSDRPTEKSARCGSRCRSACRHQQSVRHQGTDAPLENKPYGIWRCHDCIVRRNRFWYA